MKKILFLFLLICIASTAGIAQANLDDTRDATAARYGEYRILIDTDNQLWTKEEWETRGYQRAKAAAYMYSFSRQGVHIQMEVMYDSNKPQALVKAQRFTPDVPIRVKDFKTFFPELQGLISSPKTEAFATYDQLTLQFKEDQSPVSMGLLVKLPPAKEKGASYTLMAFNIQDEGRLLKDDRFINGDTYIKEFTIESIYKISANEAMETNKWQRIKNYF